MIYPKIDCVVCLTRIQFATADFLVGTLSLTTPFRLTLSKLETEFGSLKAKIMWLQNTGGKQTDKQTEIQTDILRQHRHVASHGKNTDILLQ